MKRALAVYRYRDEIGPYVRALSGAGIEPVLVEAGAPASLQEIDGLVLLGGTDVNPKRYGESRRPETDEPDDELDEAESALITEALERDLPLLAICRGLQILNVQHGGTLVQHLPDTERHRQKTPDKALPAHPVTIEPHTVLASIAGGKLHWNVNSRHHQAIARLGEGLVVTARDPQDAVIEAVERQDRRFVVGVQWHPEDQAPNDADQARLFRSFAAAL